MKTLSELKKEAYHELVAELELKLTEKEHRYEELEKSRVKTLILNNIARLLDDQGAEVDSGRIIAEVEALSVQIEKMRKQIAVLKSNRDLYAK